MSGIIRAPDWTTPTKTRFLAGWAHTVGQQVLRVDYEPKSSLGGDSRERLRKLLFAKINGQMRWQFRITDLALLCPKI